MSDSEEDDWDWVETLEPTKRQWSHDNKKIVRTRASKIVSDRLQTHDRVLITGAAGSGKSAIAHFIGLRYSMDRKSVSYSTALDEIENAPMKMIGTDFDIFVIDDPIGKSRTDPLACQWWQRQNKEFDYYLRIGLNGRKIAPNIRVIVTCRSNLIDDQTSSMFQNYSVINLDEESLAPTMEEKKKILDSHIDTSGISKNDMNAILKSASAFPALCHTVGINATFRSNIRQFFRSPYELIRNEILRIKECEQASYMGLFLLVIGDNKLSEDEFLSDCTFKDDDVENDVQEEDETSILNESVICLLNSFGLPRTTIAQDILESLDSLEGSFLTKVEGVYQFQNSLLFQTCLHYYCMNETKLFLEYCTGFFYRNFPTFEVNDKENKDSVYPHFYFKDSLIVDYTKRIASDISEKTFLDVFLCQWTSDERIYRVIEKIIVDKNPEEILEMAIKAELAKEDIGLIPLAKTNRMQLRGFSKVDLVTLGEKLSPIVLAILFSHDKIFLAMFDKLQQNEMCCRNLKKQPLLPAVCANGNTELANKILHFYGKEEPPYLWNTDEKIHAIHIAATFHHSDILTLISSQENVNLSTSFNEVPLYLALAMKRSCISYFSSQSGKEKTFIETVKCLIKMGADVRKCSFPEQKPGIIALACSKNNTHVVRILLENGAQVHEETKYALTGLHFACMRGNIDLVHLLLSKGVDVNVHGPPKQRLTALYYAAKYGHHPIVDILLSKGAKIDLQVCGWNSPLFIACRQGHENIVKLLLEYSKDILKDSDLAPSLHAAIENGKAAIVELLLQNGAKANTKEKLSKEYPLSMAATFGNVKIIKLLLDRGADIEIETKTGCTPLILASKHDHVLTAQCLLENKADVNKKDNYGKSSLFYACRYGHLDIVKLLLKHNADITVVSDSGEDVLYIASLWGHFDVANELLKFAKYNVSTKKDIFEQFSHGNDDDNDDDDIDEFPRSPLSAAVRNGHEKVVKLLIENDEDVNERVDNDGTPLIIAVREGFVDIMRYLLENGANVNLSDSENDNALHNASTCFDNSVTVIKTLLNHGIDINSAGSEGYTPLHLALLRGNRKTASCLLNHRPNVNIIAAGQSPLLLACEAGFHDVVKELLCQGAHVDPEYNGKPLTPGPLSAAAGKGSLKIVKTLIDHGAKVNPLSSDRKTPLFYATRIGNCDIMKTLIDNKARVNAPQDKYDNTCLHESVCHKNDDAMCLLLRNAADVNACNTEGVSPLMMTFDCKQGVSDKRVSHLIEHGADVNACDNEAKTSLHRAALSGYDSILEILLKNDADANKCDSNGESALFMAVRNGYGTSVKILLQNKAAIDLLNKNGESPLDIAKRNGMEDITKLLTEASDMNNEDFIKKPAEKPLVMVRSHTLGPALPRKRSPYKIPVRR